VAFKKNLDCQQKDFEIEGILCPSSIIKLTAANVQVCALDVIKSHFEIDGDEGCSASLHNDKFRPAKDNAQEVHGTFLQKLEHCSPSSLIHPIQSNGDKEIAGDKEITVLVMKSGDGDTIYAHVSSFQMKIIETMNPF
jgi:hypothetical protein